MNSRNKGKVGEREFASLLREHGFAARRGQQFSGGADSPDVISPALSWLHFEVKRTQALNLTDACAQAEGDSGGKAWVVAHRRNHAPWLITMRAEPLFFQLIRQNQPPGERTDWTDVSSLSLSWLHIEVKRTQALNLTDACVQAEGNSGGKPWVVAHQRNNAPWLITMRAETFFNFLRGAFPCPGDAPVARSLEREGQPKQQPEQ